MSASTLSDMGHDAHSIPQTDRPEQFCAADSPNSETALTTAFIRDALNGTLSIPSDFTRFGDRAPLVESVSFAYQQGGAEAARAAFEAMVQKDPGLHALQPPTLEDDEPASAQLEAPGFEPLPDAFLPDVPHENAGAWLDVYTDYASTKSPMTPFAFHESAGLVLASIAIARRLVLPMGFDNIYPNLYVLWVAVSSLFRKTTAMNIPFDLGRRLFPHLLTPQEFTPEALLSDMAGEKPANLNGNDVDPALLKRWQAQRNFAAQRGGFYDEFSGTLARAGKDYNAGLLEFIMKAYDCADEYSTSTRTHGLLVARNIYFAQIGASTPAALAYHLRSEKLWSNGWWPRFALLSPEIRKPDHANPPRNLEEPEQLASSLRHLYERLPMPTWPDAPTPLTVTLGHGVEALWEKYAEYVGHHLIDPDGDSRLISAYARMPVHGLKVAILLAAMDWPEDLAAPRIELPQFVRAIRIVEEWRANIHRTLDIADKTDYDKLETQIRSHLATAPRQGMTLRDLKRRITGRRKPHEIVEVLTQMEMVDEIRCESTKNPKGGRPTARYFLSAG